MTSPKISGYKPFKRVLIANRGEIALRIARTLRDLGIESVAVYSDADAQSRHRFEADHAVRLPGIQSADTYLALPKLMAAIDASGADAVHPGYGFLSENSGFAAAVRGEGKVFIGPPPEAMDVMGNKIHARNLMKRHGVPVVPGAEEPIKDQADLERLAKEIGFPLILKAANGGGGRGMRVVRAKGELAEAFQACAREALAYFGSGDVFCERYIETPRHIEFQVMFDAHGGGVHLFERDCSIQRRHQKLIEEAPSPFLDAKARAEIGEKAVAAARAAGYVGAGTIEFICESPTKAYFMEMNTRIQVEHPVTEMITGHDLIALQVKTAMGEPLPFAQKDLTINGWSFEARINAEDPARGFAPAPGLVTRLELPSGPWVRVDSHLYAGYTIPSAYDSMVAKVIVWGRDRHEAMARLARALSEVRLDGVPTTARFHEALLKHPKFKDGDFSTRFIEQNQAYFDEALLSLGPTADKTSVTVAAIAAASVAARSTESVRPSALSAVATPRWQNDAAREAVD